MYLTCFETYGLDFQELGNQQVADCLWCGKPKFFVRPETGQWDCKVCGLSGNLYTFLKEVHKASLAANLETLSKSRGLSSATLKAWRVGYHQPTGEYLLPAYNHKGALTNLYRCREGNGYKPFSTPKCKQQLFSPPPPMDSGRLLKDLDKHVHLCEGPWDAMALWEILSQFSLRKKPKRISTAPDFASLTPENLEPCQDPKRSLLAWYKILAVPGAGTFRDDWASLFRGRTLYLYYDHDKAGSEGVDRVIRTLGVAAGVQRDLPKACYCLRWEGSTNG